METYFASPERATDIELAEEINFVCKNPVISGLLQSVSGLLAILDEHRQVISLNDSFLRMLGVDDPGKVLGLRPGEALQCPHAFDEPGGCGTSKYCSTCGAAISIVSSLGQDKPVERICALTLNRGTKTVDLALLVRSYPMKIEDKKYLLLFVQDITLSEQRAALERTFFHDINNMLHALVGASELLRYDSPSDITNSLYNSVIRLYKEVAIQRSLSQSESYDYQPMWHEVRISQVITDLQSFFSNHPIAYKKNIQFSDNYPNISFDTDLSLLNRVLCNMILNALEATAEDDIIKLWIEKGDSQLSFCVWNRREIPQEIAPRIFQRNFSTKEQAGRGIGSFSMKLFGEKILGGHVSFKTSREEGTVFRFSLPI
jgi:nitrogen-specific signal transduction histidine kinase